MRRCVSILLLLIACVGPLSALLPGSEEARLPACCRRHGAHHCSMPEAATGPASGAEHLLSASRQCPLYRCVTAAGTAVFTPASGVAIAEARTAELVTTARAHAAVKQSRTTADRGPPALS